MSILLILSILSILSNSAVSPSASIAAGRGRKQQIASEQVAGEALVVFQADLERHAGVVRHGAR
jgi:hypothetical protein